MAAQDLAAVGLEVLPGLDLNVGHGREVLQRRLPLLLVLMRERALSDDAPDIFFIGDKTGFVIAHFLLCSWGWRPLLWKRVRSQRGYRGWIPF